MPVSASHLLPSVTAFSVSPVISLMGCGRDPVSGSTNTITKHYWGLGPAFSETRKLSTECWGCIGVSLLCSPQLPRTQLSPNNCQMESVCVWAGAQESRSGQCPHHTISPSPLCDTTLIITQKPRVCIQAEFSSGQLTNIQMQCPRTGSPLASRGLHPAPDVQWTITKILKSHC